MEAVIQRRIAPQVLGGVQIQESLQQKELMMMVVVMGKKMELMMMLLIMILRLIHKLEI